MKKARSSRGLRSSAVIIGVLALVTFALVAGVLSAAQKKAPVVVAAHTLEAGTKLSLADVEVVQVHVGAALEGAFASVDDVTGLVITVQRMPGDQVTADMVGDAAQSAGPGTRSRPPHRCPSRSTRPPAWLGCFVPATVCRPSALSTRAADHRYLAHLERRPGRDHDDEEHRSQDRRIGHDHGNRVHKRLDRYPTRPSASRRSSC